MPLMIYWVRILLARMFPAADESTTLHSHRGHEADSSLTAGLRLLTPAATGGSELSALGTLEPLTVRSRRSGSPPPCVGGHKAKRLFGLGLSLLAAASIHAAEETTTQPLAPLEAARQMTVPPGFNVSLFAGEPDVVQPIAMATDDRGRVWVVECLSYPTWQTNGVGRDRVLILEDTDGDGRADSRKVFWDKGRNLTSVAIGFGGVWLCSAPELVFIPDRDGDDVPDSGPEPVLDGWTLKAQHNIVNGLTWGPDGWLYGCHGILADSFVGRPGAPASERTKLNCSVWRFHPTRHVFEVVAHGTTNPWGLAFNDRGQLFLVNCVIKHLFHVIPGARYERMYGQDDNPYAFRLIESCADHIHWAGGFWKTEGAEHPQNDVVGGGHAHSGALIYLGDSWPRHYRNSFFALNIHGRRMNHDVLERRGSGYIGRHRPDLLRASDPWFRGVAMLAARDGSVFFSDWSDAGECHDYIDIHPENGRIYKVAYGTRPVSRDNLNLRSDADLVTLLSHSNHWYVNRARLLLQQRAAAGTLQSGTRESLTRALGESKTEVHQINLLWAIHATGGLDLETVLEQLSAPNEFVRAWAIQLGLDGATPSRALVEKLAVMARDDVSPVVRLYLASALQRLSAPERIPIAEGLLAHPEDSADPNLPSLIWFGIEPLVSSNDDAARQFLLAAKIPVVRQFIAKRLGLRLSLNTPSAVLAQSTDPALQSDIINGLFEALNGRREIPAPSAWPAVARTASRHSDAQVRDRVLLLSAVFGQREAIEQLQSILTKQGEPVARRQTALQALVQAKAPGLLGTLQSLLRDASLRAVAIRGLAAFDDASTPRLVLEQYASLTPGEKADAINTLASRPQYAIALLEAVKSGAAPSKDVSPFAARQILALKDDRLPAMLSGALGNIRSLSREKAGQIARYKAMLGPEALRQADLSAGRAVFDRTCAACHTLFGSGGTLAPELTGSQRSNLDYVLENVVDPNAVVWNRYRASYFETRDDRLISGVVLQENESTVTIQTQTETVTLPRGDIVSREESTLSMMPEGLLESLTEKEVVDFVAYLQSPAQVPLPGGVK